MPRLISRSGNLTNRPELTKVRPTRHWLRLLAAGLVFPGLAIAGEVPLFDFDGPTGSTPESGLIADSGGNLYGTTSGGGAGTDGAVYRLSPPVAGKTGWTETVLYSFCAQAPCVDGTVPLAGVTPDGKGGLFGATTEAGTHNWGTLYHLVPAAGGKTPWVLSVLYDFCGHSTPDQDCLDGGAPSGSLVRGSGGDLYGTAYYGGAHHWGAVFSLSPPGTGKTAWTYTLLHSFDFADGANPVSGLTLGADGVLYGLTPSGGAFGQGTAFQLTPPAAAGKPWDFSLIHAFCASAQCVDGAAPNGTLLRLDGPRLYGTTQTGGARGFGSVFLLTPPPAGKTSWTYQVIHDFKFSDGSDPIGGLTAGPGGLLFGATLSAGSRGYGTVFELSPPPRSGAAWTTKILHAFSGEADGVGPLGTLVRDTHGNIFGVASAGGGPPNDGQIYEITP